MYLGHMVHVTRYGVMYFYVQGFEFAFEFALSARPLRHVL